MVREAVEAHASLLEEVFPAAYLDAHDLWPPAQGPAGDSFSSSRARPWTGPGGDSSTRNCSSCSWPSPRSSGISRRPRALAPVLEATAKIDARIRRLFPFPLTAGQEQARSARNRRRHGQAAGAHESPVAGGTSARGRPSSRCMPCSWPWPTDYQAVLMAPTESPRPATHPDARPPLGSKPGPPHATHRRIARESARGSTSRHRRGQLRFGDRHSRRHSGSGAVRQARARGDRRAAQVRWCVNGPPSDKPA